MTSTVGKDKAEEILIDDDWCLVDLGVDGFGALSIDIQPACIKKYPAKLHARSVAKHLGVKEGLIYLPGQPTLIYEDSDQPVHFRQRRYFYYMSGVDFPGCIVTYIIHLDILWLWIPPPNSGSSVIFNGQNPTREEVKTKYDFDDVWPVTSLESYLSYYVSHEPGHIYLLHDFQAPKGLTKQNPCNDGSVMNATRVPVDTVKLKPAMDAARTIKSSHEIGLIRQANDISAQAHMNVLRGMSHFSNEADIEAVFTATCIAAQAKEQAYGVIAGSGPNASTLHYNANNEPLEGRQLVCLDAGCEWQCYASDVTRTFPISGKFTPEAKAIYNLVALMQETCIDMVKPGVDFRLIHMQAHKVALEGLMKLGILYNGTFDELYAAGASAAFFPHGLGHFLGLECHDTGATGNLLYMFQNQPANWMAAFYEIAKNPSTSGATLAPGMVITVEPGIYFSRYALEEVYLKIPKFASYINRELLETYYPVGGVRIEDDLLVTEDGYENLTTAPKGEEMLEIINEGMKMRIKEEEERKGMKKEKKTNGWFS